MKQGIEYLMCQQQKHPVCYCFSSICTGTGKRYPRISVHSTPTSAVRHQTTETHQAIRHKKEQYCSMYKNGWGIVILRVFLWFPHNIAVCTQMVGELSYSVCFSVAPPRPSFHPSLPKI